MTTTGWHGRRLQRARRRAGLSQTGLAKKLRTHVMTISKLERGERTPSLRYLQRLAKALGVPVTALLE